MNFRMLAAVPPDFPLAVEAAGEVSAVCTSRREDGKKVMGHQVLVDQVFSSSAELEAGVQRWSADLQQAGWTVRGPETYFTKERALLDIDAVGTKVFLTWWVPGCTHRDGDLTTDVRSAP